MPVITALKKLYPEHIIPLHHQNAWQLLMAVILSAQCTESITAISSCQAF